MGTGAVRMLKLTDVIHAILHPFSHLISSQSCFLLDGSDPTIDGTNSRLFCAAQCCPVPGSHSVAVFYRISKRKCSFTDILQLYSISCIWVSVCDKRGKDPVGHKDTKSIIMLCKERSSIY